MSFWRERDAPVMDGAELVETLNSLIGYQGDIVWGLTKPTGPSGRCLDVECGAQSSRFVAEADFLGGLKATVDWWHEIAFLRRAIAGGQR